MKKEHIETIFQSLLAADDCTDFSDKGIYLLRLLNKKNSAGETVEYGFSLTIFGVMALRAQFKGKWSEYIEITQHCQKNLNLEAEAIASGEFYRIKITDEDMLKQICTNIYEYCKSNLRGEYDCCHLYEQCSEQMKCVRPDKQRSLLCRYKKKLESGIVFFGKNRNI